MLLRGPKRVLSAMPISRLGVDGSGSSPASAAVQLVHNSLLSLHVGAVLMLNRHAFQRIPWRLGLHHSRHRSCHQSRIRAIGRRVSVLSKSKVVLTTRVRKTSRWSRISEVYTRFETSERVNIEKNSATACSSLTGIPRHPSWKS